MIEEISVYKTNRYSANIKQTSMKREWMDETWSSHAYHCFPVSIANTIGYEISFPKEISFIWDGISDTSPSHVKILSGEEYAFAGRGNATVSFYTNLVFKTSPNITLMHMPVPNFFIDGAQAFTSLISSSFYNDPFPSAWKITKANEVITIKENQPVATILPVPLKQISEINMNIYNGKYSSQYNIEKQQYGVEAQKINKTGEWTDWYRNAVDHNGNSIGKHELKSIKLKINDFTSDGYKEIK